MKAVPTSTTDVPHPEEGDGRRVWRSRRVGYIFGTFLLVGLVGSAVLDAVSEADVWGVSSEWASASGGGYHLSVRYPTVTRPALATPFEIVLRREGGFPSPVKVSIASDWLEMWDYQSFYPVADSATGTPDRVIFEFSPPPGEVLRVFFDARIQPAQQSGRDGFVTVLEGGRPATTVRFKTRVLP